MRDRGRPSAFVSGAATPYDRPVRNASPFSGRGSAPRVKRRPRWALRCEKARRQFGTEGGYTSRSRASSTA